METITALPAWRTRLLRYLEHETVPADKPGKRPMSEHAKTAKMIKARLQHVFPGVAFSVKSDIFSGGDSVDVSWTDGPTTRQVEECISRHEYGHFDGMTDMYEYSNPRDDIPQVKYVQTQRSQSRDTRRAIIDHLNNHYHGFALVYDEATGWITRESEHLRHPSGQDWQSTEIHRYFHRHPFTCPMCDAATPIGDRYCGECGHEVHPLNGI